MADVIDLTNSDDEDVPEVPVSEPKYMISVDVGRVNGGYAVFELNSQSVVELDNWNVEGTFDVHTVACRVSIVIYSLLMRFPGQSHTFVVEKQLAFTAPGRQFASTANVSIETAWHAILITKGIQCVTVDARLVKGYFELPDGPPKKKAAVL
jgi:hypothetical protein